MQYSGEVHTYEDEFPPELGPPPVPNYQGAKIVKATKPVYTVEIDAGAFHALWELLEKEGRHRFPARNTIASYEALLRAVKSFRSAYWSVNEPPAPKPTIG